MRAQVGQSQWMLIDVRGDRVDAGLLCCEMLSYKTEVLADFESILVSSTVGLN